MCLYKTIQVGMGYLLKSIFTDYKDLGANIDENGEAIESLKFMANWKNRPRDVSYPVLDVAREGESLR